MIHPNDAGLRECQEDEDCRGKDLCFPRACDDGKCVDAEPVVCDDADPCTIDECKSKTGECRSNRAPRMSMKMGSGNRWLGFSRAPGACGDDCDDQSAQSHPGGVEACDGVDNDCNGITDDGYQFHSTGQAPILRSCRFQGRRERRGSLTDEQWVFFVTTHDAKYDAQVLGLDSVGNETFRTPISATNSDTFAGSMQWSGQVLATVWEDRRDSDYEIYFNRFDPFGNKIDPDLRISDAPGFSLDPVVMFTGTDYFVAWSDGRNGGDEFGVYAQRLDILGAPIGDNIHLTPDFVDAKSVSLAAGVTEIGMTFVFPGPNGDQVAFRAFPHDLTELVPRRLFRTPCIARDGRLCGGAVSVVLDRI